MLVTHHRDVPGMVGRIGTILGEANVNISTMQVARSARGGEAMMVLEVDREIGREVVDCDRARRRHGRRCALVRV